MEEGGSDEAQVMMKGRRFLGNSLVLQAKRRPGGGVTAPVDFSHLAQSVSVLLCLQLINTFFCLFVCFLDIEPN